jgi:hypothetical protein
MFQRKFGHCSEFNLQEADGHEVSTARGSDRVRSHDVGSRGEGDPVATAPGTDVMSRRKLKLEV